MSAGIVQGLGGSASDQRAPFIPVKATKQGQLETRSRDVEMLLADILYELQAISYAMSLQVMVDRQELNERYVDSNTPLSMP